MTSSAVSPASFPSTNRRRDPPLFCRCKIVSFRPRNTVRRQSAKWRASRPLFSPPEGAWHTWLEQSGTNDVFGGWFVARPQQTKGKHEDYSPWVLAVGAGASVAVVIAALAHFSLSKNGPESYLNILFRALHGLESHSEIGSSSNLQRKISSQILEDKNGKVHDASILSVNNAMPGDKKRMIPVASDSTQQQAFFALKKLKIIEDDVKPDELCTRREYARWLIKSNSLLERKPRHKIVVSVATCSSVVTAFDDVDVVDRDFWYIQALGEVGIIPCRHSGMKTNVSEENGSVNGGKFDFEPEGTLSRLDLVNWRAQLEYVFTPGIEEKFR